MAKKQEQQPMTDEQIADVFRTLRLPTSSPRGPIAKEQQLKQIVFFPITGNSPPLQAH